ncbi:hypothetical protein EDD16DRAFT_1634036, partial [Pisolithus croceorrhizus]
TSASCIFPGSWTSLVVSCFLSVLSPAGRCVQHGNLAISGPYVVTFVAVTATHHSHPSLRLFGQQRVFAFMVSRRQRKQCFVYLVNPQCS